MLFSTKEQHLRYQNSATITTTPTTTTPTTTPTITATSKSTAATLTSTASATSIVAAIYQQNNFFLIFLDFFMYLTIILMIHDHIPLVLLVDISYYINNLNRENSRFMLFYSFIAGRIQIWSCFYSLTIVIPILLHIEYHSKFILGIFYNSKQLLPKQISRYEIFPYSNFLK